MRIGLSGFSRHPWDSVERTRRFYLHALGSEFNLEIFERRRKYDAVINFSGPECWCLPEHPKCPLIFVLHGGPVLDTEFLRAHAKRLNTNDSLIVNCSSDLAIIASMFGNVRPRLCQLPLPVDLSSFRPRSQEQARQILSIDRAAKVLGFVARFIPLKNLHQFLLMFADIMRRVNRLTGVIIGEFWVDYPVLNYSADHYRTYIAELVRKLGVAERLQYYPWGLDDKMIANCLCAMDLLIHPTHSIDENFGYIVVEAMACGTPVVGTAYGGLKDTIASGKTGFLMPTWATESGIRMDVRAGVREAVRLLTERNRWRKLSKASVQRVRAKYRYEACAPILVNEVKNTVIQARRSPGRIVAKQMAVRNAQFFGHLPKIGKPWERYFPPVSQYVSGPIPELHDGTYVRVAAPLKALGHSRFELQDPAWPAIFHLTSSDSALIGQCRDWVKVRHFRHFDRNVREHLQNLVARGVLICSL